MSLILKYDVIFINFELFFDNALSAVHLTRIDTMGKKTK